MTMTLPASPSATERAASLDQILRIVVGLFGAIEGISSVSSLSDLSTLFGDISIALHPLLGLAAIVFALTGKLRYGIAALALLALTRWASDMPSVITHGFPLSESTFLNAEAFFKIFIQPIIGAAAIAAVWLNRHLTVATFAVTLPTLVNAAGIAAFVISVMLYGF